MNLPDDLFGTEEAFRKYIESKAWAEAPKQGSLLPDHVIYFPHHDIYVAKDLEAAHLPVYYVKTGSDLRLMIDTASTYRRFMPK